MPLFRRARSTPPEAPPARGPQPPVILLHGYTMASPYMWLAEWMIRRSGRRVINIGYNSYHTGIPLIAQRVAARVRREVGDAPLIDAVTHSMGGIVLRWAANHADLPRLRRVVQTGPPNRGASFADWLDERWPGPILRALTGETFRQLRVGPRGLCERAGLLEGAEVGVIAGGRLKPSGYNPKINGDNDFLVAVEETVLPGMKAFLVVRCEHGLLCWNPSVIRQAIHFLDHGDFRRDRTPPKAARGKPPEREPAKA